MKNKTKTIALVAVLSFSFTGLIAGPLAEAEQQARLYRFKPAVSKKLNPKLSDKKLLTTIARDTWGYFHDAVDKENGLPLDNVLVSVDQTKVMSYTSTTNIGLYLMCLVAAQDLKFISRKEAEKRMKVTLATLRRLSRWEGQYFNYYDTITTDATSSFVSSVDNGWLAAGLLVAEQAHPALQSEIGELLGEIDFSKLYDPYVGQLYGGYDNDKKAFTPNHYGLLCTEPRATSYLGIARGDLPEEHWYKLFRTLPADWTWQAQTPKGVMKNVKGVSVFYGYYSRGDLTYVPSWGGSMFEFLMPTLIIDEQGLSPKGLGANNKKVVAEHIRFAMEEKNYPVWGISPCATPDTPQGYKEYGVPYLGSKGYADLGVITPHASFLALAVDPESAVANIRNLAKIKGLYGEYGFYDSVNIKTGKTSPRFLALDQGMTLVSLANHLTGRSVRERFMSHPLMKKGVSLLTDEVYNH